MGEQFCVNAAMKTVSLVNRCQLWYDYTHIQASIKKRGFSRAQTAIFQTCVGVAGYAVLLALTALGLITSAAYGQPWDEPWEQDILCMNLNQYAQTLGISGTAATKVGH